MAHILKFKAADAAGILMHNTRTGHTPEHTHSNEQIDTSRTHLNYELQDGAGYPRYKARLTELHCMQRADVTTFDSLVVTLPKDVEKGDERAFFESCYAFAKQDYGENNIVNATVHMDETTPHIHIGFIPVVHGKRRNGEPCDKVRHSSLITQSYLKQMHPRLSDFVEKDLGYKVEILNGATLGGNKTKLEMQIEQLQKQLAELMQQLAAAELALSEKEEKEKEKERIIAEKDEYIKQLQETIEKMQERESRLQRQALEYEIEPKGKFEPQSHYDKRRAWHEVQVGVKHADEQNARTAQNNANESHRLADAKADFEEYRESEEKRLRDKNEETARKAADIDGAINQAAYELNKDLFDKVDKLTEENNELSESVRFYREQHCLDEQEKRELKDEIERLNAPEQSYGYQGFHR